MAADDVYRMDWHFENPSGSSSCGIYLKEDGSNGTIQDICKDIADAAHTKFVAAVRAMMSSEWRFTAIRIRQVYPTVAVTPQNPGPNSPGNFNRAPHAQYTRTVDGPGQTGTYNGGAAEPSLPANNSVQIDLEQTQFSLKSNGRINIPGIPEAEQVGPNISTALVALANGVAALLELPLASLTDTGTWDPVIVSAKVRDAAGPGNPKDWLTSVALITAARANPIISVQARRTTKVVGGIR